MKKVLSLMIVFLLLLTTGCSQNNEKESGTLMYYVNENGNGLETKQIQDLSEDADEAAEELETLFADESGIPEGCSSVLCNSITIDSVKIKKDTIVVDLKGDYGSVSNTEKLLLRAGITKTFQQVPGIQSVEIRIQDNPLLDSDGNEYGALSAEEFVIPNGDDLNAYTKVLMELYFLDENDDIVKENRNVYFRSSVPVEQVVMEELIKGPLIEGNKAAVPSTLGFNNVMIQEDIGYVDFTESLNMVMEGYDVEKAFETISKSFQSVCKVEKVQFSVNGDTAVSVGGVSLAQTF